MTFAKGFKGNWGIIEWLLTSLTRECALMNFKANNQTLRRNLIFVDPCIIVKFVQKNPTSCNSISEFIIPHLYEAQHVSGDTPPIIRSLKLHWQPLVWHTWKVVGRVVAGRCHSCILLVISIRFVL